MHALPLKPTGARVGVLRAADRAEVGLFVHVWKLFSNIALPPSIMLLLWHLCRLLCWPQQYLLFAACSSTLEAAGSAGCRPPGNFPSGYRVFGLGDISNATPGEECFCEWTPIFRTLYMNKPPLDGERTSCRRPGRTSPSKRRF